MAEGERGVELLDARNDSESKDYRHNNDVDDKLKSK